MELVRFLLYVSQVMGSVDEEAKDVLREKALINSSHQNVTGLLVYRKGFFMQYLEGPDGVVKNLFRQLRCTRCHHNVRLLTGGHFKERLFNNWTVRWVTTDEAIPSSESLIDLFETVLTSKAASIDELNAILRRFGKNSQQVMELTQ